MLFVHAIIYLELLYCILVTCCIYVFFCSNKSTTTPPSHTIPGWCYDGERRKILSAVADPL
jgi:hypothetical protein